MQYIVDVALALVLVLNVVRCTKRGLIKSLFGLVSVIIAIVAAYFFGSTAGGFLRTTGAYEHLLDSTSDKIYEYFQNEASESSDKAFEGLQDTAFIKQLENMGVDTKKVLIRYSKDMQTGAADAAESFAEGIARPVLEILSNVVGTVLVFVICLLLLFLLSLLLNSLFRLPFLRQLNKIGGFIAGIILGVFYAFILCMIIKSLLPCLPENPVIYQGMEEDTVLYAFFSSINPLYLLLFGKFFNLN